MHKSRSSPHTIAQLLRETSAALYGHRGRETWTEEERRHTARQEAQTLLEWGLGWSAIRIWTSLHDVVPDGVKERIEAAIQQRLAGRPLQFITGQAAFYGRQFHVEPGCLIPRPETEILVQTAIRWITMHKPSATVYDIGCGSGILAATVALECPKTTVHAVDISPSAIRIAQHNFARFQASVCTHLADGIAILRSIADGQIPPIDALLSNPPYIPSSDIRSLADEVVLHEPTLALDGGQDGLDYYRAMVHIGDGMFTPNNPAALFWEIGIGQHEEIIGMFKRAKSLWPNWGFTAELDLRGIPRVIIGLRT